VTRLTVIHGGAPGSTVSKRFDPDLELQVRADRAELDWGYRPDTLEGLQTKFGTGLRFLSQCFAWLDADTAGTLAEVRATIDYLARVTDRMEALGKEGT
jgi:hypothetical protein